MTFDEVWEQSRSNAWSQLIFVPAGVAAIGLVVLSLWCRSDAVRRLAKLAIVFLAMLAAAELSHHAVVEKWRVRAAAATTDEERQAVAHGDGANITVAPLVSMFETACILLLVQVTAVGIASDVRKRRQRARPGDAQTS